MPIEASHPTQSRTNTPAELVMIGDAGLQGEAVLPVGFALHDDQIVPIGIIEFQPRLEIGRFLGKCFGWELEGLARSVGVITDPMCGVPSSLRMSRAQLALFRAIASLRRRRTVAIHVSPASVVGKILAQGG